MQPQPFIKWSGSKRSQAKEIISYFPENIDRYYEPFLGSGAVMASLKPKKAIVSDINKPLINLWNLLKDQPDDLFEEYKKHWSNLQSRGHTYYYETRDYFNKTQDPHSFLFLTRTCVNGLIRFNKQGEFNNSLHHTRKGINPELFKKVILAWSDIIQDYSFLNEDYKSATDAAKSSDFIYLDPPYFNTGTRYFGTIDYDMFLEYLEHLNMRGIKFALSYDGLRGDKSFVVDLPKKLYKRHVLLPSGNSAFNKVQNGKIEEVFESLYLNY